MLTYNESPWCKRLSVWNPKEFMPVGKTAVSAPFCQIWYIFISGSNLLSYKGSSPQFYSTESDRAQDLFRDVSFVSEIFRRSTWSGPAWGTICSFCNTSILNNSDIVVAESHKILKDCIYILQRSKLNDFEDIYI